MFWYLSSAFGEFFWMDSEKELIERFVLSEEWPGELVEEGSGISKIWAGMSRDVAEDFSETTEM